MHIILCGGLCPRFCANSPNYLLCVHGLSQIVVIRLTFLSPLCIYPYCFQQWLFLYKFFATYFLLLSFSQLLCTLFLVRVGIYKSGLGSAHPASCTRFFIVKSNCKCKKGNAHSAFMFQYLNSVE